MLQVSCVNVYNYPEVLQKIRWITEMNKKYEEMGRYEVKTAKSSLQNLDGGCRSECMYMGVSCLKFFIIQCWEEKGND